MTRVVISQPMFFPWVGLLEQVRLADVFVHYDDVQFSRGFFNRVQIKTAAGPRWLTVPLRNLRRGQAIRDVGVVPDADWRRSHLDRLRGAYADAPHLREMLDLVEGVHARPASDLSEIAIASLDALIAYFDLGASRRFLRSSQLTLSGAGWRRLLDIVLSLGGDVYVTGHGARRYLDHEAFEREGVRVEYMDYRKTPYPQLHGPFTPFVSSLDLVANVGREGRDLIHSGTIPWRAFLEAGP